MSLATGTISSGSSNGIAQTTGPKISSRTTFMSLLVLVRIVGCDEVAAVADAAAADDRLGARRRGPTPGSRAPSRTARRRSAAPSACPASMPGADLDLLGLLGDARDDVVETAALDVQARAGVAALAVVEEDAVGGAGDRGVEVGVGEDDVRRLAAELQRDLLEVARPPPATISLPTSVEPVNATLSTSACAASAAPALAEAR